MVICNVILYKMLVISRIHYFIQNNNYQSMSQKDYLDGCHKIRKFSSKGAHNPKSKVNIRFINNINKNNLSTTICDRDVFQYSNLCIK